MKSVGIIKLLRGAGIAMAEWLARLLHTDSEEELFRRSLRAASLESNCEFPMGDNICPSTTRNNRK